MVDWIEAGRTLCEIGCLVPRKQARGVYILHMYLFVGQISHMCIIEGLVLTN